MNCLNIHDFYLDELINKFDEIDESKKDIAWIMRNGIWIRQNSINFLKMPDLIVYHYDNHYSIIELKGNLNKKEKAKVQLYNGENFVRYFFRNNKGRYINKKFVTYSEKGYYFEEII